MTKGKSVPAPAITPMEKQKTIQDMTLIELKALVYDLSEEIAQRTQVVNTINEEIRKRGLSSPQNRSKSITPA